MCKDLQVKLSSKAAENLKERFVKMHDQRNKYFGNARAVRSIIDQAIRNMHLRQSEAQTKKMSNTISYSDIIDIDGRTGQDIFVKNRIGYGAR